MKPHLVLIVDDDEAFRDTLRMVLEDEGYRAATASNGADALRWLGQASELPCVILLDLMMPTMDGWEFRLAQASDPRIAPICTAVLSANLSGLGSIDADYVLPKPVQLSHLLEVVGSCCGAAA